MSLVNVKQIKNFVKESGMNCSKDLTDALDKDIEMYLLKAVSRAADNGRSTVMVRDL